MGGIAAGGALAVTDRFFHWHDYLSLYEKAACMEPTFLGVVMFLIPLFLIIFLLIRKVDKDEKTIAHNMYKNYRKTRMDKPVL